MSDAHSPPSVNSGFDPTELPTTTESVHRTLVCSLNSSRRKNARLRDTIDEWQQITATVADFLPSFPPYQWEQIAKKQGATSARRLMKENHPDHEQYAHNSYEAVYKVAESFASWDERGRPGDKPRGEFGSAEYIRIGSRHVTLDRSDGVYGIELDLRSGGPGNRNSEWFRINVGEYQREHLDKVIEGDDKTATAEVSIESDGSVRMNLVISSTVEVLDISSVDESEYKAIGIDIGSRIIYAAACVNENGDVTNPDLQRGGEFRHTRERLTDKRDEFQADGKLREMKELKGERRRYTDHMTHVFSRQVIDYARKFKPCVLVLEDLTDYRKTAKNPIHDWPFNEIQERIIYKARGEGIPIDIVDAHHTSTTCRKCGQSDPANRPRNDDYFECRRCGYNPPHADVNAAINIGLRHYE